MVNFSMAISNGQTLTIKSGSVSISGRSALSLNETSLHNDGSFRTDSNTKILLKGRSDITISGSGEIKAHSLIIDAECTMDTDLRILDNIVLRSGNLDLSDNILFLEGEIHDETNTRRIFSSGSGEITKTIDLPANINVNPGNIGITINSLTGQPLLEVRRGHLASYNSSVNSIKRYYSISTLSEKYSIAFHYFDTELNDLKENALGLWGETANSWRPVPSKIDEDNNLLTAELSEHYSKYTLFPVETIDVAVPSGFSPNGDGVNDYFTIDRIEEFPNNKLIIFNQWGDILYEASPYTNNWNGESGQRLGAGKDKKLTDGTYFYFFLRDRDNPESLHKGFIELKNNSE